MEPVILIVGTHPCGLIGVAKHLVEVDDGIELPAVANPVVDGLAQGLVVVRPVHRVADGRDGGTDNLQTFSACLADEQLVGLNEFLLCFLHAAAAANVVDAFIDDDAVTDVATVITDGVPYASVVAPAGTTLAPDTDYYIVVAPAALTSGYRIEFTTSDGFTFSKDYTGTTYNAATFKRNNIASVGKKNLDKYETPLEGYWRLTSQEEFGEGSYLFGYPMGDGNIRIFDESKTDCFISGGTDLVNKFSNVPIYSLLSVWNRWTAGGESPTIMRHYVMWAFRNAYVDTDSGTSVTGFTYVGDDLILNPNDKFRLPVDADNTLSMKLGYKSGGQQYKNVQLSGCTLNLDENGGGKVVGRITEQSIENLIDIFYISKGSSCTMFASKADALTAAKKACDKDTTVGFCTVEQTTNAGDKMNNMYMIQNYHICSSPAPAAIWLYKKGVKAVSYLKYKEINN